MNKDNDSFQVRYIMLRTKVFDMIDKSNILKGLAYVLMMMDNMKGIKNEFRYMCNKIR